VSPTGSFPVEGREEVAAGFDELRRSLGDMSETHREVLGPLIPEVRARTPVLTGALASSWILTVDKSSGSIESGLVYAGPLEFGSSSRGIEPVSMVRDTIRSNESAINEGYSKAIADKAKSIGFEVGS
jgi:predicted fused transcriptional regulator/phosphomethylpyrimidine kinase